MEWMIRPLRRYADFQGRSRRMEFWMFQLLIVLLAAVFAVIILTMVDFRGGGSGAGSAVSIAGGLLTAVAAITYLAIIVPAIAVQVRRFHDQDKSGWLVLLNFVPYIGGFIVLVFMCLEGTRGPNRFGPDPKNPDDTLASVFN